MRRNAGLAGVRDRPGDLDVIYTVFYTASLLELGPFFRFRPPDPFGLSLNPCYLLSRTVSLSHDDAETWNIFLSLFSSLTCKKECG